MPVPRFRVSRSLAFGWLVLFSIILLAGCGASISPTAAVPTADPADAGKMNLTVWHTLTGVKRETLETLARDFTKTYPDLEISPVYIGNSDDLTKQMTAAIALGSAPDLILADRRQIADFAAQGGLYPLDALMNEADLGLSRRDRADFLPGMLDLGKYPTLNNQTYGFPFDEEAMVLFYNPALLKGINIDAPPQTWDQFGDFATAVTEAPTYGWAMRSNADTLEAMLVSRGSALLTDKETKALFNERAGVAALKLFSALSESGAAELATSDEKARTAFASGKAAFYIGWMSELDTLRAAQKEAHKNFVIGVAPLPQLDPQTPWLLTRGDMFAIPQVTQGRSLSERARNAWFFVRWITTSTPAAQWVRATDALPLRASALTFVSTATATSGRFAQVATAFNGILPRLAPQPAPAHMDAVEEQVSGLWLQANQPKPDIAAMLDALAARVNQILAVKP